MSIRPSFAQGYAQCRYESNAPEQWEGLVGAWAPFLGNQGNTLYDLSCLGHVGTSTAPIWDTGRGGTGFVHATTATLTSFGPSNVLLPTGPITIVLHYEKRDGANRASGAFGVGAGAGPSNRCGVHLPYSDGIVYWDYGGEAGGFRLSASGLVFGLDLWVFTNGPRGMEIWQNGVRRASNASNNTRVAIADTFYFGFHGGMGSDLANYYQFRIYNIQWTDQCIGQVSVDPYAMLRLRRRVWVIGGAAALIKVVADDLDLENSISRNLTISRFSTDDLEFDDQIGRNLTLLRFTADDLELTDPVNRNLALVRTNIDELELTDSNPHLKFMPRSVVDDLELTDTDLKTLGFTRSATDDLELTDSDANFLGKTRFTTDDLSLVDSPSRSMEMRRSVIDVLNLISISQRGRGLVRSVVDLLSLLDSIPRFGSKMRAVVDDLELTDSTHKAAEFIKSVVDDLNLTDSARKVTGFVRSVVDEIEFVDTVQKVVNTVGEGAARIIQRGIKWFRHGGSG